MSADDAWTASSNDALVLSLVAPSATGGVKTITNFHPQFTYPIFGDDEQIFGYQGLQISLRYNANDMRPNLHVTCKKKFQAVGETEANDINMILHDFLPGVAFQNSKEFEAAIKDVPSDWTPPGELVTCLNTGKSTYEVWKGNLEDPAVKQLVGRIQILVPLFIEGGTQLALDEPELDRWTVFFLYEKRPVPGEAGRFTYVFAGYCTVYGFYPFRGALTPPASPGAKSKEVKEFALDSDFSLSDLPCRSRISQFIIIPPFQNKGLGPQLYSTIFQYYYASHPQTFEITVEDPNEAFDDMRDVADLHFLRSGPLAAEFDALRINTSLVLPTSSSDSPAPNNIVDRAACEAVRGKAKIAPRQFYRVLEMHTMSKLPASVRPAGPLSLEEEEASAWGKGAGKKKATKEELHEYRLWRLMVKKRIYIHNKDALGQLELEERIEKLDETVETVENDFVRLLEKAGAHKRRLAAQAEAAAAAGETSNTNGKAKRKSPENGDEAEASVAKKARFAVEEGADA